MSDYKKTKGYGNVYGDSVVTPRCRIVWPSLVTPKPSIFKKDDGTPQPPKFEATFLLDKEDAAVEQFRTKVLEMVKAMLPVYNKGQAAKITIAEPFKDGDEQDTEKYPYFANQWIMRGTLAQDQKIATVSSEKDADGNWLDIDPATILGGQIVKAMVQPFLTGKGVSYKLEAVRFVEDDGVRIGGGVRDVKSVLAELDTEDDTSAKTSAKKATNGVKKVTQVVEDDEEPPARKTGKSNIANIL